MHTPCLPDQIHRRRPRFAVQALNPIQGCISIFPKHQKDSTETPQPFLIVDLSLILGFPSSDRENCRVDSFQASEVRVTI